ncbi:MAG: prolyl-tRNA synthetase associated domain-containing protein [Acidimicrobiia bacterium]|nr:prolyl-tRNA synthetase associated domain-containing protein [Acidimicrobiia bacterium]
MTTELQRPMTPPDLLAYLMALDISTTTFEHPPLFTVEDSKALRGELPGGHCKNLFLRNKKGKMWLVVCPEDRELDLKDLGARIGAGRVSFGSPDRLMTYLGVSPGAVTPFAAVNDVKADVEVVLDEKMMTESVLNFHPLVNHQTTAISPHDLVSFLASVGHPPQIIDLR